MYYLLEVNFFVDPSPYRTRLKTDAFKLQPSRWITGQLMELDGKRLEVDLWERHGNALSEVFLDSVPLFRRDVCKALVEAGAENFQTCPVVLRYPSGDEVPGQEYAAVNIVGAIRCADLDQSEYDDITGTGLVAMGFRKLVIDEEKAGGALFFRLAEAMASIIVHERVKEHLESKGFQYLSFRALS